jgi:hypothetical protein
MPAPHALRPLRPSNYFLSSSKSAEWLCIPHRLQIGVAKESCCDHCERMSDDLFLVR